jgi:hypothetical protein
MPRSKRSHIQNCHTHNCKCGAYGCAWTVVSNCHRIVTSSLKSSVVLSVFATLGTSIDVRIDPELHRLSAGLAGADIRRLAVKTIVDVGYPFACIMTGTAGLELVKAL